MKKIAIITTLIGIWILIQCASIDTTSIATNNALCWGLFGGIVVICQSVYIFIKNS